MDKNDTIVLTGGAGFIGSCVLRTLNDAGYNNIVVVDNIQTTEKWKNLINKKYIEYVNRDYFLERLLDNDFEKISTIIHMGACSSTTESDFDYLWDNNVEYTKCLWNFCSDRRIPLIYASSAATYGDGSQGFSDDIDVIDELRPLNGYGYSKQVFDQWSLKQTVAPAQHVGLKFFNVYGPNEYCKGSMASMVYHGFNQIIENGKVRLFKSENEKYADGEQERDFVYVKDVCKVIMFFLEHPEINGIFNVGTGRAQTFKELIAATFSALNVEVAIEYIDVPDKLREKYQYHTQADISKLRAVGYKETFCTVEEGVKDYVVNHLGKNYDVF
ncbi:MAG: ADP-glyceromanno-heptose 6-epimerase [Acetatifactor sp.]|nr:ADP-glyceromanno-heptose 6-epimerase [Acetatifactor sp.]